MHLFTPPRGPANEFTHARERTLTRFMHGRAAMGSWGTATRGYSPHLPTPGLCKARLPSAAGHGNLRVLGVLPSTWRNVVSEEAPAWNPTLHSEEVDPV